MIARQRHDEYRALCHAGNKNERASFHTASSQRDIGGSASIHDSTSTSFDIATEHAFCCLIK